MFQRYFHGKVARTLNVLTPMWRPRNCGAVKREMWRVILSTFNFSLLRTTSCSSAAPFLPFVFRDVDCYHNNSLASRALKETAWAWFINRRKKSRSRRDLYSEKFDAADVLSKLKGRDENCFMVDCAGHVNRKRGWRLL